MFKVSLCWQNGVKYFCCKTKLKPIYHRKKHTSVSGFSSEKRLGCWKGDGLKFKCVLKPAILRHCKWNSEWANIKLPNKTRGTWQNQFQLTDHSKVYCHQIVSKQPYLVSPSNPVIQPGCWCMYSVIAVQSASWEST